MWALKILHEKNWRVSLCVQELCHPQDFYLFWGFWLAWRRIPESAANNGFQGSIISSTCELDIGTGWESIPLGSSLSRVSLSVNTVVVGEVDELEEDVV